MLFVSQSNKTNMGYCLNTGANAEVACDQYHKYKVHLPFACLSPHSFQLVLVLVADISFHYLLNLGFIAALTLMLVDISA